MRRAVHRALSRLSEGNGVDENSIDGEDAAKESGTPTDDPIPPISGPEGVMNEKGLYDDVDNNELECQDGIKNAGSEFQKLRMRLKVAPHHNLTLQAHQTPTLALGM